MTPEERMQTENNLKETFQQEKEDLDALKKSLQQETDENKKSEKEGEIQQLDNDIENLQPQVDVISDLSEADLNSLKEKIEKINLMIKKFQAEFQNLRGEIEQAQFHEMPTTYEILKDSETCNKLRDIIAKNPDKFKNIPGENAEKKLEYIFQKIRSSINLFLQNKLGNSDKAKEISKNTIAPALERNLMKLLRDQGHDANVNTLKKIDEIKFDSLIKLCNGVDKLGKKASGAYGSFQSWINALDYISVHKGVMNISGKSKVLSNPLAFQEYLDNQLFKDANFSPYMSVSAEDRNKLFQIDDNASFNYGITEEEKSQVLEEIGKIEVVDSPKTTALIAGMLDKPEQFLKKTAGLQEVANGLLDAVNGVSPVAKLLGVDILGEISKSPEERGWMYTIVDFVCKLIGITGGLEGIVKKWRYDRLDLTPDKDENIISVFSKYQEIAGENENISITDSDTCKSALDKFVLHDSSQASSSKGDFLRDAMVENIDLGLISPSVVGECLGSEYIKTEKITENGKQIEKQIVDSSKITDQNKITLIENHIQNMRNYYSSEDNFDNLKEFFATIRTVDDLALYMTASLYADKNDVVEGVKAKVFLPESYGILLNGELSQSDIYSGTGRDNLESSVEDSDKNHVSEQYIYDQAKKYGMTDNRQIAYVLATVKGECGFKNIKENGGEDKDYGKVDSQTGKAYYGRGFIQLTHKSNYEAYTQIIRSSGKIFKNNDGVVIESDSIDLVNNPDLILQSNDLSSFILIDWMMNGGPSRLEEKKISHYIHDDTCDYYNARQIVNGMSSSPEKFQNYANSYLNKLTASTDNDSGESLESIEGIDILIGPELEAKNKFAIGGLGNSIMCGFQGYTNKTNFPKMDGIEGKNTRTHPNRFKSQQDVKKYVTDNPGIKSFILYFGANTQNNGQTLNDIQERSEWLEAEGVQPVLCTCIGEDRHTWLTELNTKIKTLGTEKNWPVFDFASLYNDKKVSMGGDHPNESGYSTMAGCINYSLSH